MSRWFRWYEGTSEDGKFRMVARMSRVTVRDVIALWAFILEDAAHLDHRGVCKRNEDFMASILDFEDGVVESILEAMESAGMISVGMGDITICNWCKRQFEGDTDPTAADRQRRKRERDKPVSNAPVTRDSRPPETETETDSEKKEGTRRVPRLSDDDFEKFKAKYPRRSGANPWKPARKALEAAIARGALMVEILAALDSGVGFDREKIGTEFIPRASTWVREERWKDGGGSGPLEKYEPTPDQWREHVDFFKRVGRWPREIGPDPTSPSCRAPPELLTEFGYRDRAA